MAVRDVVQAAAGVGGGGGEYVEDVFSTYLYTGNSSTQTITNGIDLAGEGGMVWTKDRGPVSASHYLTDTAIGIDQYLKSDVTNAQQFSNTRITSLNLDGYTLGSNAATNASGASYASWTFRKAPKFFDVVTWTGNNTNNRQILHSLGSRPGMVVVKNISEAADWYVWHRSLAPSGGSAANIRLNTTDAVQYSDYYVEDSTSSEYIQLGLYGGLNESGRTYVAYVFAHDAGGFGDDGEQNVISCGSYTGNGSATGPVIDLGYEPQWLLIKRTDNARAWYLLDNMRGLATGSSGDVFFEIDTSAAESSSSNAYVGLTPTGFSLETTAAGFNASGGTYIYIAIRRPMKTPESGTEVFEVYQGDGTGPPGVQTSFPVDFGFYRALTNSSSNWEVGTRLLQGKELAFNTTGAEFDDSKNQFDYQDGWRTGSISSIFYAWNFRRAPGFFDVVAYTGTSSVRTVAHNLGVPPELIIAKNRTGRPSQDGHWLVYDKFNTATNYMILNLNSQSNATSGAWNNTEPTSSVFTLGTLNWVNVSGEPNVAYLFASCPGVSKVGSYTGNGSTQAIDCGFSNGARFVLIKRTDSTGDWMVWDTARGIVSGNDPRMALNSTDAEYTGGDYLLVPSASGFTVAASSLVNLNNASFIFLAIA